jgi:hypothetical protein
MPRLSGTHGGRRIPRAACFHLRPPKGTEKLIPEKMDHCEISIRMKVMNEVQFLLASKPSKPLKPRSFDVVLLVEEYVRVERGSACADLNRKKIDGQYEVWERCYQQHRDEEEGCDVAFVAEIFTGNKMITGIVSVMEIDVVAEQLPAYCMMGKLVVHQRLTKRHDKMRYDGGQDI